MTNAARRRWRITGQSPRTDRAPVHPPSPGDVLWSVHADSQIPTAMIGTSGRVLRVNDAFCSVLARPVRDLLGLHLPQLMSDEDHAYITAELARLESGDADAIGCELALMTMSGKTTDVHLLQDSVSASTLRTLLGPAAAPQPCRRPRRLS